MHRTDKASAQEMAHEPVESVDFDSGIVIQGLAAWRQYRAWRNKMVKLQPEVRKAFPDDASVNEALKIVMQVRQLPLRDAKKRKTA